MAADSKQNKMLLYILVVVRIHNLRLGRDALYYSELYYSPKTLRAHINNDVSPKSGFCSK